MKKILPYISASTQIAFVLARLIIYNVLVTYESICTTKNKRRGKDGFCVVKLVMHKAYDRVESVFLERHGG